MKITEKLARRLDFIKRYLIEFNLEGIDNLSDDELEEYSKALRNKIRKLERLAGNNPEAEEAKTAQKKADEFADNLNFVEKEIGKRKGEDTEEPKKEPEVKDEPKKEPEVKDEPSSDTKAVQVRDPNQDTQKPDDKDSKAIQVRDPKQDDKEEKGLAIRKPDTDGGKSGGERGGSKGTSSGKGTGGQTGGDGDGGKSGKTTTTTTTTTTKKKRDGKPSTKGKGSQPEPQSKATQGGTGDDFDPDAPDTGNTVLNKIKRTIGDVMMDPKERKEYVEDLKTELKELELEYKALQLELKEVKDGNPEDEEEPEPEEDEEGEDGEDGEEEITTTTDTETQTDDGEGKGKPQLALGPGDEKGGNEEQQWLKKWQAYKGFKDLHGKATKKLEQMKKKGEGGAGKGIEQIGKISTEKEKEWKDFKDKNLLGPGQDNETKFKMLVQKAEDPDKEVFIPRKKKKKDDEKLALPSGKQKALPVGEAKEAQGSSKKGKSIANYSDDMKKEERILKIKDRMRKIIERMKVIKEELLEAKLKLKTILKNLKRAASGAKNVLQKTVKVKN